ncbi:oxidoreductase [Hahella sp. CCB-MM4]|uniref:(Fe-S)-binding protein n=1 Tax=Hahella sp. (strain CCB-MM4) TaxID=1926491 RepID=UPI000BC75B5F|nr:(Fe-S)-binding protein [Hahella sp. CCB-MM4]OZG71721.1 oxidoreductase [Hahella sp. CCB-MM4]
MHGTTMTRDYPEKPKQVYFFGTCLIDLFYPEAGLHGIQLIEREGIAVFFPPEQSCCGQPAYNSGYDDEARSVAAAQIACFPKDIPVVVPSASCASMIREQYPSLFEGSSLEQAARSLAERTYELTEFLVEVCHIQLKDQGEPVKIVVHHSCSAQRHMRTSHQTQKLLNQLGNVAVVQQERANECCGFGGTFSVKAPEISNAMVQDKCDSLMATGAQQLVTGDCGCMMNITGAIEKRGDQLNGKHVASFIWERTQ